MNTVVKHKTQGLQYLANSFAAFNGSGYGDMSTPEEYVQSYVDYNKWKNRKELVSLAEQYDEELYNLASHLIEKSHGAGRTASGKGMAKFNNFRNNLHNNISII